MPTYRVRVGVQSQSDAHDRLEIQMNAYDVCVEAASKAKAIAKARRIARKAVAAEHPGCVVAATSIYEFEPL